jgi:hypothetical protein
MVFPPTKPRAIKSAVTEGKIVRLTAKIDSDYTAVDDFHERDSEEITDFRKTISNQETLCSVAMR